MESRVRDQKVVHTAKDVTSSLGPPLIVPVAEYVSMINSCVFIKDALDNAFVVGFPMVKRGKDIGSMELTSRMTFLTVLFNGHSSYMNEFSS